MALILVRHALPLVRPAVASRHWGLTEQAMEDCLLLAAALPAALPAALASPVYTSGERKALQTASILALRRGLATKVDDRLREVDGRPWLAEGYEEQAARYLEGRGGEAWEPRDAVTLRFSAAVDDAMAASGDLDTVVVDHGLAMSLFVASVTGLDAAKFWRGLSFPDAWRLAAATLERIPPMGFGSAGGEPTAPGRTG